MSSQKGPSYIYIYISFRFGWQPRQLLLDQKKGLNHRVGPSLHQPTSAPYSPSQPLTASRAFCLAIHFPALGYSIFYSAILSILVGIARRSTCKPRMANTCACAWLTAVMHHDHHHHHYYHLIANHPLIPFSPLTWLVLDRDPATYPASVGRHGGQRSSSKLSGIQFA